MSKKLNASRLQKKNHFSVEWVITCEEGTEIKDLINPSYFANIANRVNKNDLIRAIFDDGSYIVDLIVIEVDKTNLTPLWVKTIITNLVDINQCKNFKLEDKSNKKDKKQEEESFESDIVSLIFRGPILKWSVLRKEDKVVLREKIESKSDAIKIAEEIINQLKQ